MKKQTMNKKRYIAYKNIRHKRFWHFIVCKFSKKIADEVYVRLLNGGES